MPTTAAPPAIAALLERARALHRERAAREPGWLGERRREALERLAARGLPTPRDEDWKYTNLAPFARVDWARPCVPYAPSLREAAARLRLPIPGAIHLVVADGRYLPELSVLPPEPAGLFFGSILAGLAARPEAVEPHLARLAAGGDRFVADLSTALFEDGLLLHLARGTCLPVPVDVLHLSTGRGTAAFPRTLLVGEPESRATVVERFLCVHGGEYAHVPVTEVALARNAALEHVQWQQESEGAIHLAALEARQERDSRLASHALTLGAALSRNDTGVVLDGEGAEVAMNGLYVLDGERHADHHTRIDHARPHGISRELYKGILDGKSTGVFNGRVLVRPGAQKTDSQQANHNLLLSDDAVADTKPELEIYADDVKCSHGATVGRLEDDKLFYLRSRGLDAAEARDLLLKAFARDVTERISVEAVHAMFERWIAARAPAARGATP